MENQLSEVDQLRIQLATEKVARIAFELIIAKRDLADLHNSIRIRYKMLHGDDCNVGTGIITRKVGAKEPSSATD